MTFAYTLGRLAAKRPVQIGGVLLVALAVFGYMGEDNKPPATAQRLAAPTVQLANLPDKDKAQCDADRDKISQALKAAKTDAAIVDALRKCENYLGEPERAQLKTARTREFEKQAKATAKALAENDKAEKLAKRKQGVTIGMTKDDVLASQWGRPEKINTTITANGQREQWVYGSRHYLYFYDNVLTSIQTGK